MFRIHEAQMEALGARSRARFVAMMAGYVEEHFAYMADATSREELEGWVSAAVDVAERHGVTTEPEAAQLVLLLLVLGLDAEETTDWVGGALRNRDLAGVGKVRKLVHLAREHGIEGIEDVLVVKEVCEA
jgi:hypothetical protein